jgi:hypothetical protein
VKGCRGQAAAIGLVECVGDFGDAQAIVFLVVAVAWARSGKRIKEGGGCG